MSSLMMRHPVNYDTILPNFFITAHSGMQVTEGKEKYTKIVPLTVSEQKMLHSVIHANGMSDEQEKIQFEIPYAKVFSKGYLRSNSLKDVVAKITEGLQMRVLFLDGQTARLVFQETGDDLKAATLMMFTDIRYYKDHFKVTLHPHYKRALGLFKVMGYTKGDYETLMSFKHQASFPMYWRIRFFQRSTKDKVIPLSELRDMLYTADAYPKWPEFERNVLAKVKKDMEKTYPAFDYEPVRNGRSVVAVHFKFQRGPVEERDLPVGMGYRFEEALSGYGVSDVCILKIRNWVKANQASPLGFVWQEDYVTLSLEALRQAFKKKASNRAAKQIEKPGAYIYSGLVEGRWLNQVVEARKSLGVVDDPVPTLSPANTPHLQQARPMESYDDYLKGYMDLFELMRSDPRNRFGSFEQFMKESHTLNSEGRWVRK
ncbi:MAG: replication initiation protein [Cytophagales bacterium]|nr:replication initiation protein [Cytophagales bacterium]